MGRHTQAMRERIGEFELLETLGSGGMGTVYRARQLSLDRIVALKILPDSLASDREFVQRFLQEARATAKLNHPYIVAGFDVGCADGHFYFAMELVNGVSMGHRIQELKRLPEAEAARAGAQIARALEHAHAHGIVHRDVKPDNIILAAEGAKLTDFGLARGEQHASLELTQTGRTVGTAHYMAPEQVTGQKNMDGRADQYALGCTLFKAVTGRPPFEGESSPVILYKHLRERMPNLHGLRPDLSDGFCAILHRMTARQREERYPDMGRVAEEFEALLEGRWVRHRSRHAMKAHKARAHHEPDRPPTHRHAPVSAPSSKVRTAVALGVLAAAGLLSLVYLATSDARAVADQPPKENTSLAQPTVQPEPLPPAETPAAEPYVVRVALPAAPEPAVRPPLLLFDGDKRHGGKGWTSGGAKSKSITLQESKGRNGRAAIEFQAEGRGWIGAGWNWTGWSPNASRVDLRNYNKLRLSVRVWSRGEALDDIRIGLCSPGTREPAGLVSARQHSRDALDGRWHELELPIAGLLRHSPGKGFDPAQAFELVLHTYGGKDRTFAVLIDHIAFE